MAAVLALLIHIDVAAQRLQASFPGRPQDLCVWLEDTSAHHVRATVSVKQLPMPVDKPGLPV